MILSARRTKLLAQFIGSHSASFYKTTRRIWLTSLLLFCVAGWGNAANALNVLNDQADSFEITSNLTYWIDGSNQKNLDDLLKTPDVFIPYTKKVYSQGYSKGSHWLHFDVQVNSTDQTKLLRLLEINFPLLWQLELYVLDGEQLIYSAKTGSAYPASSRPFKHSNFVFPLDLPTNRPLSFYLRTQNDGPIMLPITLWQTEAFTTYTGWRETGFGIYFGIMLALAVYNFFLFLSIRTPAYLWYTANILGTCLINVSVSGFGGQHLWPEWPYFAFIAATLFSYITNYVSLQFTRSFLNSREAAPVLDRCMAYLCWLQLGYLSIFFFMPKAVSLMLFTVISLVTISLIVGTGVVCYRRGQYTARFFLLAWGIFEVTIVIKLLSLAGVIPNTNLTHYAVIFGSICEGLLLALALADQINQLKSAETKYQQQALAVSEESNRLKDEFLTTISHELRTPMNGVKGALQLLKKENLPEPADSYVDLAQLSTQDMLGLIDSILGFSEVQSGNLKLVSEPFNLAEEFLPQLDRLTSQARNKGLAVTTHLSINEHQYLLGDAPRLLTMFYQLINNAIKFTHKGSISIDLKQQDGHVEFKVKDTGVGIDSLQSSKIFAAFSQLEGSFNRRFGGLGIGLSICQRLSSLMQGELKFESELGKGSEFSLTLNLPLAPTPKTNDQPVTALSVAQVLVVEDNPVNMQILTAMLQKMGVSYITKCNGEQAVEYFSQLNAGAPAANFVFMDCQMPVVDGFEATRTIRTLNKIGESVPIVAVTANALSGDRQRCLEAGMDDYIIKPVSYDIIRQSLLRWLPEQEQAQAKMSLH